MHITITLIIHAIIAFSLLLGGIYALRQGFKLIETGKGTNLENSRINLFGIKAELSSIGALTMTTAFFWGYAAVLALPSYEDSDVTIASLSEELEETQEELRLLRSPILGTFPEAGVIDRYLEEDRLEDLYLKISKIDSIRTFILKDELDSARIEIVELTEILVREQSEQM